MRALPLLSGLLLTVAGMSPVLAADAESAAIERGRYLVHIAGCNDCHTTGWMQTGGQVPEADWLTGDSLGWNGPWGTTYPANLRLYMQALSEAEWLVKARNLQTLPPMPWFALNAMHDDDLRAIYHFLRHLGPKGEPAPAYVGPGLEPGTPYLVMEPRLPQQTSLPQ